MTKEQRHAANDKTTYSWNSDNGLIVVKQPTSPTVTTMTYNGDGLRTEKEDSSQTLRGVWDRQNLVRETNGSNATQAVYTQTPGFYGNLLSQRRGSTSRFALTDALGSVTGLISAAQSLSDSYLYKAYGETPASSGSTVNPFRWVGEKGYYFDSGLSNYYVRARHYDAATARWMSVDRLQSWFAANAPYGYSLADPSTFRDPSGNRPDMSDTFICRQLSNRCIGNLIGCVCGIISWMDTITSLPGLSVAPQIRLLSNLIGGLDCLCEIGDPFAKACDCDTPYALAASLPFLALLDCMGDFFDFVSGPSNLRSLIQMIKQLLDEILDGISGASGGPLPWAA
ncbi:MAG: RHS repeat-associated core domain-containing protein [Planctomycetota bacterium]